MVDSINQNLIGKLNTILTDEETKVTKLIQDVDDESSGLVHDLNKLKETVDDITPPPGAPSLLHITGEENGLL